MASTKTASQPVFLWQGTDPKGKLHKGEMQGQNSALVKALLRKQGIRNPAVRRKPRPLFAPGKPRIRPQDIAIFTRQLATMMKAGIPLVQSFDIVADGLQNPTMRELVRTVRDEVAAGTSFADAVGKHPREFDELFCNLVAAGEQSGTLEAMLERLAIYREKSEALKSRIRKALNYPITVLVIAIAVSGILLVKVVPQFATTFASFGAELPLVTQYVLQLSGLARAWWLQVLGGLLLVAWLFRTARQRSRAFANAMQHLALKLPVFGAILQKSALARCTRTLATTFAAGVALPEALQACAGAAGNVVYRKAILQARDEVTTGLQLSFSLRSQQLFPPLILQMVAIGEESGALDAMLDKCAVFYEAEVDNAVDGLTAMMEPMIMAVLGILVGGLMVAMYLPIFQIGSVI